MKTPLKLSFVWFMALGWIVSFPFLESRAQSTPPAAEATTQLAPSAAEIIRLVNAGVERNVLLGFIGNSTNLFNLTADDLIQLHNQGVPTEITTAMLQHDYDLRQATFTNQVTSATPTTTNALVNGVPAIEPPRIIEGQPAIQQFQQALAPYGTWFQLPEWGWVWQPKEAAQNRDWRPYLDGGRWAWTDHGWFWESDYPWGWAGFHYGRWLEIENIGWVWFPDTVWAPSWVTWRYHGDNMGWAPLPPNAITGETVTEQQVFSNYDYGVPQQAYTFVDVHYIFVRDVRRHCLPERKVREFYPHCKVVNDYGPGKHHGVVNRGVPIERVSLATGRRHTPVPVFKGGSDRGRDHNSPRSPGYGGPTQHQQPIAPGFAGSAPRYDDRSATKPNTLPAAPRLPAAPGTPGRSPNVNPGAATPMNPIVPPINPGATPMNPFGSTDRVPGLTPAPPFRPAPPVHPSAPSSGSIPGQGHGQNKDWKSDRHRSREATPTPSAGSPVVAAPGLTPAPPFRSAPPVQPATPHAFSGQGHGQSKNWKEDRNRSHQTTPAPASTPRPVPAPGFRPQPEVATRPAPAAAPQKQTWAVAGPQQEHRNQEKRNKK